MEFAYYYRTSAGVRTRGTMKARNKEQVFGELRKQGIKAIKVERISGAMMRGLTALGAMAVIAVCIAIGTWLGGRGMRGETVTVNEPTNSGVRVVVGKVPAVAPAVSARLAKRRARKRIEGLKAVDATKIFRHPSEVYLTRFAEPGRRAVAGRFEDVTEMLEDDLMDAVEDDIILNDDDSPTVVELKRVVVGLKEEAATLLASGKSIAEIRDWFEGRQRMEMEYRRMILSSSESEEEKNARLRAVGMALANE